MKKIFFRADANSEIGYGHFIRILALADMLKHDFECKFFTVSPSDYQVQEMQRVCPFEVLDEDVKFEQFLRRLNGDEIVVLDNYFFTPEYQLKIRIKGCKVVYVGDFPNVNYVADVVISPFLSDQDRLRCAPYTKVYRGLDWALLRKPFLHSDCSHKIDGTWLISFGGTDYLNMTEKFLEILDKSQDVRKVTVIVGDAFRFVDNLCKYSKATVKMNLSAEEMSHEMEMAKYAILPCSGVCVEALACGCRIVSGYFVDNQKESSELWEELGYILNLGDMTTYSSTDFIQDVNNLLPVKVDFSRIVARYINLFRTLAYRNA